MLDGMRAASQNWMGRLLMAVVMGVIVVSFAIWGIGDIFRGFGAGKLGVVGSTEISSEAYRFAYQNELQRLQQQTGRVITNDQARAAGLDRQVLGRLVTEATLDQKAANLGLYMSDAQVAQLILADPTFQDPSGKFDRMRFEAILRDNGYNERSFVREQKGNYLRREIGEAVAGQLQPPELMTQMIDRFQNETRSVDWVTLTAAQAGDIPAPAADELSKFYDAHKASFVAPQYRKIVTLAITPASVAKPQDVSDADAQKLYDAVKTQRFGAPEKREVQQIIFPSEAEALAASDKIKGGATFEAIAAARKLTKSDTDLGAVVRTAIHDPAIASTAFALKPGEVSSPVKSEFGYALVRVGAVTPESVKPFAEVAQQLKTEIARDRAKKAVQDLHDKIEDARASGKPLAEAAKSVGLETRTVDAVDARGFDKNGQSVQGLAAEQDLLRAVFASDVGVDNDTISTRDGGYVWFEVAKVDPSRQLSLDDVKDKAAAAWKADEIEQKLAAKASDMVARLKTGVALSKIAADQKLDLKHDGGVKRSGAAGLDPKTLIAIFNEPDKGAGSSATSSDSRIVFQILDSAVPNFNPDSDANKQIAKQLQPLVSDDVVTQYIQRLEQDYGVKISTEAMREAIGAADQ
ncbi:MAG: SurA N-terminal domain-containing protein [Hyphomicrobiales bacterium]|nr:SurA N-terminal domain-containing protein [Hyphomicrobiales bacterium]